MAKDGEISILECDCPFDQEAICKHMVATMLAIRDKSDEDGKGTNHDAGVGAAISLGELLRGLDKAELVDILLAYANEDDTLERELIFRYLDRAAISDTLSYARMLIRESIDSVSDRGFINWNHTRHAVKGVYQAFELVTDCLKRSDCMSAIGICLVVLEEMTILESSCDDSSGYVGDAIDQALGCLEKCVRSFARHAGSEHNEAFRVLFAHALLPQYDDWPERRLQVLFAGVPLYVSPDIRKAVEGYLIEWLDDETKHQHASFYSRFTVGLIEELQERIIRKSDGAKAAEDFISSHLDNDVFRERRYEAAMKKAEVDEALKLSIGGVENAIASGHFGDADKWRQREYQAYKRAGDIENQRRLAKTIATSISNDRFKYYIELKDTFTEAEWPKALDGILDELQQVSHGSSIYLQVLRHECLKPQLMDYCREHPTMVFELCREILPEYRQELDTMLCELIDDMAKRVSTRGEYYELCAKLRIYGSAIDRDKALAIRDKILAANPRKPALRDELGKL
jgi:hypothetical protein